ncbi:MAG: hypothetical protein UY40_C0013G0013 [candidate division CPR1 bacterium GW2011_GWC1_49_13]|uniref:Uncharacterized protein n=1 Tax=candidate division CPR1 bacterium GW2011_GWC1_49_13 TaxID=1618342 RepID=A0A0G1VHB7_9BACT|nr:MAG: hypothetical protein UY40_C0013G0013 [candidate division CPR1 bacterium GW2011_GWC1_49_13]
MRTCNEHRRRESQRFYGRLSVGRASAQAWDDGTDGFVFSDRLGLETGLPCVCGRTRYVRFASSVSCVRCGRVRP